MLYYATYAECKTTHRYHSIYSIAGSIPIELTKLSTLTSINLSGNRMSGEIPNELENIKSLRFLNLAGQRDFGGFSGPVPSFNRSSHLHEIDISRNSLTGTVPSDFLLSVRTSAIHDDYSGVQIDL
jgi:Leucine-rich repeat (LRR) protein